MARPGDVAALANFARDKLGTVDLWCAVASLGVTVSELFAPLQARMQLFV